MTSTPRSLRARLQVRLRVVLLLVGFFVFVLVTVHGTKNVSNRFKTFQNTIKLMYAPIIHQEKSPSCSWLKSLKRQYKLCRSDPGLDSVLLRARNLAVQHCEEQFRYDRWNCSRPRKTFKNVYRETALLYAMASSALTFSIARACAEGKLMNCHCAKDPEPKNNIKSWQLGLCSVNLKYAKQFTKKFLHLNQRGDKQIQVLRHDSVVGIDTVTKNVIRICKCQGLSGSCQMKICYRIIEAFGSTADKLKAKYHASKKMKLENKVLSRISTNESRGKLFYMVDSPSFCKSTPGRLCLHRENCASLCCTRGYTTTQVLRTGHCKCQVENGCCTVKCDNCSYYEDEYRCK